MATQRPITRAPSAPPIVATQNLSAVYQTDDDATPLSELVGRYLHLYGLETFQSEAYGLGVRLAVREADENGHEVSDEFKVISFAYRVKEMAKAILRDQPWIGFVPPVRVQVQTFSTPKGASYYLADA
jgi:hypothetical protein